LYPFPFQLISWKYGKKLTVCGRRGKKKNFSHLLKKKSAVPLFPCKIYVIMMFATDGEELFICCCKGEGGAKEEKFSSRAQCSVPGTSEYLKPSF
jgi:hypothetical protein